MTAYFKIAVLITAFGLSSEKTVKKSLRQTNPEDCLQYAVMKSQNVVSLLHCAALLTIFEADSLISPNLSYFKGSLQSPPKCYLHKVTYASSADFDLTLDSSTCYTTIESFNGVDLEVAKLDKVIRIVPIEGSTPAKAAGNFVKDPKSWTCSYMSGSNGNNHYWQESLGGNYYVTKVIILIDYTNSNLFESLEIRVQSNKMQSADREAANICGSISADEFKKKITNFTIECPNGGSYGKYIILQQLKTMCPPCSLCMHYCAMDIYGIPDGQ